MNKFNPLPEAEDEQISNCCSALMTMGFCGDCKEQATAVSEEEINEARAFDEEYEKRKLESQKYV